MGSHPGRGLLQTVLTVSGQCVLIARIADNVCL